MGIKTANLLEFCDRDFDGMEKETELFLEKVRAENEAAVKKAREEGKTFIPLAELLDHQKGLL